MIICVFILRHDLYFLLYSTTLLNSVLLCSFQPTTCYSFILYSLLCSTRLYTTLDCSTVFSTQLYQYQNPLPKDPFTNIFTKILLILHYSNVGYYSLTLCSTLLYSILLHDVQDIECKYGVLECKYRTILHGSTTYNLSTGF